MVTNTSKKFEDFLDHFAVSFVVDFSIFIYSTNELNFFFTMFSEE